MKCLPVPASQSLLFCCILLVSIRGSTEDLVAAPPSDDKPLDNIVVPIALFLENDPNLIAMVKPLVEGTQRTVAAKLQLIRLTGKLTETQNQSLKQFNAQWVQDQVWKSIHDLRRQDTPARRARGIKDDKEAFTQWLIGVQQGQDGSSDAIVEGVDKQLDQALAKILTQEQIEVYQAEQQAKSQYHRQASAEFFLALIRKQINISDQQAEQLKLILEKHHRKNLSWVGYIHNPKFLPILPKRAVAQVLTPEQRKVFEKITQNNFQFAGFNFARSIGLENLEDLGAAQ
jgi:hypothetical protein